MRDRHIKIAEFWELTAQAMTEKPFRRQFRMKNTTLAALTSYLQIEVRSGSGGVESTTAEKMVAMTTAFLGCQTGYQQMSVLFDVSEDTFIRCTQKVVKKLIEKSKENYPVSTQRELQYCCGRV